MPERIALYPGTFDPITNGHIDIITRAAKLVDKLVIGVAMNAGKGPIFSLDERVALVEAEVRPIAERAGITVAIRPFSSLLIQFAEEVGAQMIIRGLRAVSDFDYEFQMTGMNYRLDPRIETVFLMASEHHQFISSRFVKDIAAFGGDITSFVPKLTAETTVAKLGTAKPKG
ncbi:pantetheine-phosphate adenylyltransferase [Acidocella sp.]|uniref:pantetheine-phosphate adenylyltransferase n=1 Tax=Acidocella sp. TaxID=50710 RepID=UPI0026319E6A|nr:pantetheine-phosphate adenylyltransferase [Acidocella sp.]